MIFFLYGHDDYRSRQKMNELKQKYVREVDLTGNSLVVINGETIDSAKLNENIAPSSLFVRRRMVVIEKIFANKRQDIFTDLTKILKGNEGSNANDNIVIVWDEISGTDKELNRDKKILFDYLLKQKAQEFEPLSNTKIATWIKEETEKRGGKISFSGANALAGLVGTDLWQISNEIDKLISYKQAKENKLLDKNANVMIEPADVEEIVMGQFDENIFALTDAISQKNKALAVRLLEEQIQAGADEQRLFSMIVRQFRILLQIRAALDSSLTPRQMATQLKLHPFIVQKGITQVRNFSAQFLKKMYSHLAKIDYTNKTGRGDLRTMLDLLIVKL